MNDNKKETIGNDLENFIKEKKNGEVLYLGDDTERFILGESGANPIICFGINPSTANDIKYDPTILKIRKIASENNCDSWVMLNLYPQRATNPNDMHEKADNDLKIKNYEVIRSVFNIYPNALTLASWGNAIEKRKYLKDCLKEILAIAPDRKWVCRGKLTVKGNPRHQLYVPDNTKLQDLYFSLEGKVLCSKD
jgi:serine/threonine protein phosphatase